MGPASGTAGRRPARRGPRSFTFTCSACTWRGRRGYQPPACPDCRCAGTLQLRRPTPPGDCVTTTPTDDTDGLANVPAPDLGYLRGLTAARAFLAHFTNPDLDTGFDLRTVQRLHGAVAALADNMEERLTEAAAAEPADDPVTLIRRAIYDPGRYLPRRRLEQRAGDDFPYEPVYAWGARAALDALTDAGMNPADAPVLRAVIDQMQRDLTQVAAAAIDLFLEERDQHGAPEDVARANVITALATAAVDAEQLVRDKRDSGGQAGQNRPAG